MENKVDSGSTFRFLLADELDHLRARADRSDPLDETVLCLVEAAMHAAAAAELTRHQQDDDEVEAALHKVLDAARAAVVTAKFAMAQERRQARPLWARRQHRGETGRGPVPGAVSPAGHANTAS